MASQWWIDDDELLATLGDAVRTARDMPANFAEVGKATFTWHSIDADLATLTRDSARAEEEVLASARSEPANLRSLTFTSAQLTIELEVSSGALLGQIVPPQAGRIDACAASGHVQTAAIDEIGCFAIRRIPEGSFRLHCQTVSGASVITNWITL
jgi:hypothetical protein